MCENHHHSYILASQEPPQRCMMVIVLKKGSKKLVVLRLHTCLRILAVRSVSPGDTDLVLLRASLREPQCGVDGHDSDLLGQWTWIAVFPSLGNVTEFSCAGVSRAVSVRVHALAWVFAVEGGILFETHFWHHRIVTTLARLPACHTREAPECRCTPLSVQTDLTNIRVLLLSRAHSLLVCTRGNLLLPAPILASFWPPSGVALLAASLS